MISFDDFLTWTKASILICNLLACRHLQCRSRINNPAGDTNEAHFDYCGSHGHSESANCHALRLCSCALLCAWRRHVPSLARVYRSSVQSAWTMNSFLIWEIFKVQNREPDLIRNQSSESSNDWLNKAENRKWTGLRHHLASEAIGTIISILTMLHNEYCPPYYQPYCIMAI